ncbi:MAG: type II toxin-antitoxin system MqsA family antitoxin [SAR324 cluster bacterium]|nr:type II toxin-antitoxin system MqsA family antitoxin [SAR324 cluster bacterium]
MKCVLCRNGEKLFTISRDRVAVVVKNVPAQVCQNCGEAYAGDVTASRIFNQDEELVKSDNDVEILHFAA